MSNTESLDRYNLQKQKLFEVLSGFLKAEKGPEMKKFERKRSRSTQVNCN